MQVALAGQLKKMRVEHHDPVEYYFILGDQECGLNAVIGQSISLRLLGEIHCIQCGRKTSKSFQQGFCFPCMRRINECGNCVIHPERCRVEEGSCPKDDWAHAHCHADQIVYLANTSGLKVGVTRQTQVPTRWLDQGAMQALPIFATSNRYQAGLIEVALKQYVNDKTNWRTMLKQDSVLMDLCHQRDELMTLAESELDSILQQYPDQIQSLTADEVLIRFPLSAYPSKVVSLSLDKTPYIEGQLIGIKGQYLILDTGVLNVRKFSGYSLELNIR